MQYKGDLQEDDTLSIIGKGVANTIQHILNYIGYIL